jgi:hypothetical protein
MPKALNARHIEAAGSGSGRNFDVRLGTRAAYPLTTCAETLPFKIWDVAARFSLVG